MTASRWRSQVVTSAASQPSVALHGSPPHDLLALPSAPFLKEILSGGLLPADQAMLKHNVKRGLNRFSPIASCVPFDP